MEPRTALVRRFYAALDAGDVEAALAIFAPDVSYRRGSREFGTYAEVADFYRAGRSATILSGTHELSSVTDDGIAVTVEGEFRGALADGSTDTVAFADRFEFKGPLVRRRVSTFPGKEI